MIGLRLGPTAVALLLLVTLCSGREPPSVRAPARQFLQLNSAGGLNASSPFSNSSRPLRGPSPAPGPSNTSDQRAAGAPGGNFNIKVVMPGLNPLSTPTPTPTASTPPTSSGGDQRYAPEQAGDDGHGADRDAPGPPGEVVVSMKKGGHLSGGVIAGITVGATFAALAMVASAIQLARKRRARRALLVHRDGPIRKESSLSTQPVLEVGPRSDGVDGEGKGGSGGGEPIVPIVQRYKNHVFVPNFVAKQLGGRMVTAYAAGAHAHESAALVHPQTQPAIEMQALGLQGGDGDPMDIDDPPQHSELYSEVDTSQAMEYESSDTFHESTSYIAAHGGWERQDRGLNVHDPGEATSSGAQDSVRRMQGCTMLPGRHSLEGSAQSSRRSSAGSLLDADIDAQDITILTRDDGQPWKLGEGAFGSVFKALRCGVTEVAVKIMNPGASVDLRSFRQEAAVLASCRDPAICQFLGACFDPGNLMIVTEFCDFGDLRSRLSSFDDGDEFLWRARGRGIMLQVAKGLVHLHQRQIIHFDLKAANILLTRSGQAKIADVGLASVLSQASYVNHLNHNGTFAFAAPELLMGQRCGLEADIFSLGVLLFEVATGEIPKRGCMREISAPEEAANEKLDELIQACTASDPKKRPTARQVHDLLADMQ